MKKILVCLIAVMSVMFISCKDIVTPVTPDDLVEPTPSPTAPSGFKAGTFDVKKFEGASSRAVVTMDVGTISSADSVFFFLKNTGTTAITNVTMTSNDPQFVVTPGTITEIRPDATTSVYTLCRIAINHGRVVGGVGIADLIAAGAHNSTVTISGKTTDADGVVIDAEAVTINISSFINIADFEIEVYATKLCLSTTPVNKWVKVSADEIIQGLYMYNSKDMFQQTYIDFNQIRITNTGNVPLKVGNGVSITQGIMPSDSFVLAVGETKDITYFSAIAGQDTQLTYYNQVFNILVSTNQTVFPMSKYLYKTDDGVNAKIYAPTTIDYIANTDIISVNLLNKIYR